MEFKIRMNNLSNPNLIVIKIKYGVKNLIILFVIPIRIIINVHIKYVINKNLPIKIKMWWTYLLIY